MKYSYFLLSSAANVLASPLPEVLVQGNTQQTPNPPGCVSQRQDPFGLVRPPTCWSNQSTPGFVPDSRWPDCGSKPCQQSTPPPAPSTSSNQRPASSSIKSVVTLPPVSQIPDGQIQHPKTSPISSQTQPSSKSVMTMPPVSQIPDGQIQQPKTSPVSSQPQSSSKSVMTMPPVSQIPDGQIQQPKTSPATSMPQSSSKPQSSSQPQSSSKPQTSSPPQSSSRPQTSSQPQTFSKPVTTMPAISQIPDGQIQQPKSSSQSSPAKPSTTSAPPMSSSARPSLPLVSVIKDGQLQAPSARQTMPTSTDSSLGACANNKTLTLTLENGVLKDVNGWTGYIAANRQFQFDKPPQAGALRVSGWSVCGNGSLALDGSSVFWECLSGDFYNLYDRSIAPYCRPITLNAAQLLKC